MAQLRSLDFEAFPGEIRLKIYRLLLADDAGILDPTEWVDEMPLHTNILRCNKKIHDEAAAVLYGENCFDWDMRGDRNRKLWHRDGSAKTCVPRKYSRLITMVRLKVDFRGDDNDPSWQAVMNGFDQTKANLDHACELLTLNDLKASQSFSITLTPAAQIATPWAVLGFRGSLTLANTVCCLC